MQANVTNIWQQFHLELRAFIVKAINDPVDADDVLQEVFLRVILNRDKVGAARNLKQYLYAMVRNAVGDYFRKRQKDRNQRQITDEYLTEADRVSLNETIASSCVKPFIEALPAKYREALLLTEFEQLSQKELAKHLNISYSGAKSRVQRGREKLKALILACCAYESDRYGNLRAPASEDCSC